MTVATKPLLRPATKEEYDDLRGKIEFCEQSQCWLRPIEWLIDLWIKAEKEPIDVNGEGVLLNHKTVNDLFIYMHRFDRGYDNRYWSMFRTEVMFDAYGEFIRGHGIDFDFVLDKVFHQPNEVFRWSDLLSPSQSSIVDLLTQWARITHPEFSVNDGSDFPIFADLLQEEGKEGWAERFRYYADWSA